MSASPTTSSPTKSSSPSVPRLHLQDANKDIDFVANLKAIQQSHSYVKEEFKAAVDTKTEQYVATLPAIHRCSSSTFFDFVIRDGGLRSRENQTELSAYDLNSFLAEHLMEGQALDQSFGSKAHVEMKGLINEFDVNGTATNYLMSRSMKEEFAKALSAEMKRKKEYMESVSAVPASSLPGLKVSQDEKLGTNKQVFATLGMNRHNANGEIIIILKRDILYHPDTNLSLGAATSYLSGRNIFFRPYSYAMLPGKPSPAAKIAEIYGKPLQDADSNTLFPEVTEQERIDLYKRSVLHPSVQGWENVVAQDLHLLAKQFLKRQKMTVKNNFEDVLNYYKIVNAHGVVEVHLPKRVNVQYFEKIYMPESCKTNPKYADMINKTVFTNGQKLQSLIEFYNEKTTNLFELQAKVCQQKMLASTSTSTAPEKLSGFHFSIRNNQGAEMYLPTKFATPGKGSMLFQVKGTHIRVTLSPLRQDSRGTETRVYNIVIGAFDNSKSYIKDVNKPNTTIRDEKTAAQHGSRVVADPEKLTWYWITVDNGKVRVGKGSNLGEAKEVIMSWDDPKPVPVQYIGISNFYALIDFRNVQIQ